MVVMGLTTKDNKEVLIKKIASYVSDEPNDIDSDEDTKNKALKVASTMLKMAAEKHKNLEVQIQKLALENEALSLENFNKQRRIDSEKLANDMFHKGLIKKSDIATKTDELFKMEKDAFLIVEEAMNNIPEKKASDEYISSLTYLHDDCIIKDKENDLSRAISDFITRR